MKKQLLTRRRNQIRILPTIMEERRNTKFKKPPKSPLLRKPLWHSSSHTKLKLQKISTQKYSKMKKKQSNNNNNKKKSSNSSSNNHGRRNNNPISLQSLLLRKPLWHSSSHTKLHHFKKKYLKIFKNEETIKQ